MTPFFYVDAFNLNFGSSRGTPYKWLDLAKLMEIVFPRNQVATIRYFTAKVLPRPSDPDQPTRQEWSAAIRTRLNQCGSSSTNSRNQWASSIHSRSPAVFFKLTPPSIGTFARRHWQRANSHPRCGTARARSQSQRPGDRSMTLGSDRARR